MFYFVKPLIQILDEEDEEVWDSVSRFYAYLNIEHKGFILKLQKICCMMQVLEARECHKKTLRKVTRFGKRDLICCWVSKGPSQRDGSFE